MAMLLSFVDRLGCSSCLLTSASRRTSPSRSQRWPSSSTSSLTFGSRKRRRRCRRGETEQTAKMPVPAQSCAMIVGVYPALDGTPIIRHQASFRPSREEIPRRLKMAQRKLHQGRIRPASRAVRLFRLTALALKVCDLRSCQISATMRRMHSGTTRYAKIAPVSSLSPTECG